MSDPVNLKDSLVHRLRAAVKAARKLVDDQVEIVETAKNYPNIPKEMISQYCQQLLDLFNRGESLMLEFENKNSFLLEKLDFLMLRFEFEHIEQHAKVESLRNRLAGESHSHKGKFRKWE